MANTMINSLKHGDENYSLAIPYGVCSTAADTAAKTVTINNFALTTGSMVVVKFTYANSVASPTLNVNGTGAKAIKRYGTTAVSTGTTTTGWVAGAVQMFTYDGTNWVRDYWNNTTYSNASLGSGYATCTTAAATTAKVGTLSSYSLTTGGIVSVKFTNAVPASATLNINDKGAKNIYFRGAAITANVIKAGDIATFVYSSQYHLISIDRWQNDIASIGNGTLIIKQNGVPKGTFTANQSGDSTIELENTTYSLSDFGLTPTVTELNYMGGVTSYVQAQLDDKAPEEHTHSAADITSGTLSSDRLSTVPIVKGGTNATSANGALTNFGLTATSTSNASIKVSSLTIGNGVITYDSTESALKITFN